MNIMGLTKESVYIVPGNHDHDRIITQGVLKKLYEDKNEEEYTSVIDILTELDISNAVLVNNLLQNNLNKEIVVSETEESVSTEEVQ